MIREGVQRRQDDAAPQSDIERIRSELGARSIVFVGLMGCGKSSIGRRLANRMSLPFVDADEEIERAAAKSIPDIFADHGEAHFRDRECRIIGRLLSNGPQVLATGGGAFMNPETRAAITRNGISIWLRAELGLLMRRVMKRDNRPLLRTEDPEAVMRRLMDERYPIYAEADFTVDSKDEPHEVLMAEIVKILAEARPLPRTAILETAREPIQ